MNYVDMHIGDYAEATGHLSALEDGMYWRMLRKYYATERPLPREVEKIQRLVGAKTAEEIDAVAAVLSDFFSLESDGWHQVRCDQVIAEYKAGEPDRAAKKLNEETRSARHRLERRRLFEVLNATGIHAVWNIGIKELRAMVLTNCGEEALKTASNHTSDAPPVTPDASQVDKPATSEGAAPVTAPATPVTGTATPVTATHSPLPINQYPISINTPLPPKGGRRLKTPIEDPEGFLAFYAEYRRKDARADAVKAWRALAPDAELQARMMAAVRGWRWADDPTKIPLPASWIRGVRWEDQGLGTGPAQPTGKPDWVTAAGFSCIEEASNFRCNAANFREFADGKRISEAAAA